MPDFFFKSVLLLLTTVSFSVDCHFSLFNPKIDTIHIVNSQSPRALSNVVEVDPNSPSILKISGKHFYKTLTLGLTTQDDSCDSKDFKQIFESAIKHHHLVEINITIGNELAVEKDHYLCVKSGIDKTRWFHQGKHFKVRVKGNDTFPLITGLRIEDNHIITFKKGIPVVPAYEDLHIRLFGIGLPSNTVFALTTEKLKERKTCANDSIVDYYNINTNEYHSEHSASIIVNLPLSINERQHFYICLQNGEDKLFYHQGISSWLSLHSIVEDLMKDEDPFPTISGLRVEDSKVHLLEDGTYTIPAYQETHIRIFGNNLPSNASFAITTSELAKNVSCATIPIDSYYKAIYNGQKSGTSVSIVVNLALSLTNDQHFYFCLKNPSDNVYYHQGTNPWLRIHSEGPMIPLWTQIIIGLFLLFLSGLFSGLNLGLMCLDSTELQVITKCGSPNERSYAKIIAPLRERGNYLLCSLLLGNVMVNSTLTILLDNVTSGLIAIISSTFSIVIFGEIIPQAICSRHGLAVGAKTSLITKFFMILTMPLSYPISKILDFFLGNEIGKIFDREKLMEYIRLTKPYNKLENDEVNIINGALCLKTKKVKEVMTKIDDVFMLPIEATMDFELMTEIVKKGYTRIPIYQNGDRNNIISLLNTKDLAFVDPDDNLPLTVVSNFYKHPIKFVLEGETLDVTLNEFKKGRSHLALVRTITGGGSKAPIYEVTGVVTLEDVIEEILQSEICDETDIITDNRFKVKRATSTKQDFSDFAKIGGGQNENAVISPQMALATYQFLSTTFDQFQMPFLSEVVLRKLMKQNIYFHSKLSSDKKENYLYENGKAADYFILVLEGRVHVVIGNENVEYEAGAFSHFGLPSITCHEHPEKRQTSSKSLPSLSIQQKNPPCDECPAANCVFLPDYSISVINEISYLKISRAVYLAAVKATVLEKHKQSEVFLDDSTTTCDNELNADHQRRLSDKDKPRGSNAARSLYELNTTNSRSPFTLDCDSVPLLKSLNRSGSLKSIPNSVNCISSNNKPLNEEENEPLLPCASIKLDTMNMANPNEKSDDSNGESKL